MSRKLSTYQQTSQALLDFNSALTKHLIGAVANAPRNLKTTFKAKVSALDVDHFEAFWKHEVGYAIASKNNYSGRAHSPQGTGKRLAEKLEYSVVNMIGQLENARLALQTGEEGQTQGFPRSPSALELQQQQQTIQFL